MAELVLDPLPEAVASALEYIAETLAIQGEFLSVRRDMSRGAYAIVASDLNRKGYLGDPKNLEKGGKTMNVHKHLLDCFEGELKVFTFIVSAIPDPSGFSFIVAIMSPFETGRLDQWGGAVLNADKGHLELPGMHNRLADAIIRGRKYKRDVMYNIDYFSIKDLPLAKVKELLGNHLNHPKRSGRVPLV